MRKKIFASFMAALITAISLSGCSRAENSQEMAKSNAGESEIETDSGEVDEIVFAYFTQNNIPETSELQRIEDLLNEYTVEKINTKVHLALFSNADYMSQVNLMLASGEQLDIFRAYAVLQLTYIKDGTALDITEYIDNELKETRDVLYKDFLKQSTVDGKVYGIMNMGSQYVPGGFTYRTDIAQELGLDMDSVSSIEDLPAIFEQVKAAYPNMTILNHGSGGMFNEIFFSRSGIFDPLGDGNIKESVSGTAYQDDATIVNLYETPEYKTYANMMKEWSEKGYWASDAATTTATEAELYMSGNCFGGFTGLGNPKHSANMSANYGYPFETVQISDTMQWSVNNGTWMVNAASKAPSAACKFLNLLYTDKYVDNLLIYGEEGVDYQLNEDGFAVPPEGFESLNDVAYTNNQNYYLWGNKWIAYSVVGGLNEEESKAQLQKNYDAKLSNYYGFSYDYESLQAEYTACLNIVKEYEKALWLGAVEVDQTLEELNKRLYAAGLQKLMDAKQEQLDAWIAQQ